MFLADVWYIWVLFCISWSAVIEPCKLEDQRNISSSTETLLNERGIIINSDKSQCLKQPELIYKYR